MRFTRKQVQEAVEKAESRMRRRAIRLSWFSLATGVVWGAAISLIMPDQFELARLWVKRFLAG